MEYLTKIIMFAFLACILAGCNDKVDFIPGPPLEPVKNCIDSSNPFLKPVATYPCDTMPPPRNARGLYNYKYMTKYIFTSVDCNPLNPQEIIFTAARLKESSYVRELWKFNVCTGEKINLINDIIDHAAFGYNGWIVFTGMDGQLWKIKSNGDSLIQITHTGQNFHPRWSKKNDTLLFIHIPDGKPPRLRWIDANGNFIRD